MRADCVCLKTDVLIISCICILDFWVGTSMYSHDTNMQGQITIHFTAPHHITPHYWISVIQVLSLTFYSYTKQVDHISLKALFLTRLNLTIKPSICNVVLLFRSVRFVVCRKDKPPSTQEPGSPPIFLGNVTKLHATVHPSRYWLRLRDLCDDAVEEICCSASFFIHDVQ